MAKSKVRASRARHEEPVEGQAGQIRCSSGNAEVEASGGAGAVEPAEWHDRSASMDSTDALFAENVEQKMSNPLAHFLAARSFLDR